MSTYTLGLTILLATAALCQGGHVYRVTTIVQEPYMMLRNVTGARGNDLYRGFIVDLLDAIADYVDFEYEIHLVPDNRYGRREGDGRWNGMVGQLVNGDADIAAAALTQTANRRAVVDFTYPFQPVSLTILMRKDIDINSIEELANQTEVNYGTFHEGATQRAFIGATDPLYRRMWAHMASQKDSPFVHDFTEGLQRVREEDFAFIVERPTGEYLVYRKPCDLKLIGRFTTDSLPRSFAFALPKRHELLNDINAAMLHLQEDMTVAKLQQKWWTDQCSLFSGGSSIKGATVTLVSGLCLVMALIRL